MTTTEVLDLTEIEQRAATTAATAAGLRDRAAAGDPTVSAEDLAAAEAAERLVALQLHAARQRHDAEQEGAAAAKLEHDRAQMQHRWSAAHGPDPELQQLLDTAVDAAVAYISAGMQKTSALDELTEQAAALGFRVPRKGDRSGPPNPIAKLGRAVLDHARQQVPGIPHIARADQVPVHTLWEQEVL
jgi:hypothetical protein